MAQTIDKIVKSKYPPKDKNVMWVDTSSNPPVQKIWDGTWKPMEVNKNVDYENNVINKPTINGVELDGNKTSSDLGVATSQQGAKADTAYQKPSGGIPQSDLSSDVQSQLNKHFKGWFDTFEKLKAAHTATDGDSAYVKDASPATTWSIYVYDSTASSDNYWTDSGTDADTSNVQTFASSQEVNEVHIVNDLTTGGVNDVLSAEQGKEIGEEIYGTEDWTSVAKIHIKPGISTSSSTLYSFTKKPIVTGKTYKIDIVIENNAINKGTLYLKNEGGSYVYFTTYEGYTKSRVFTNNFSSSLEIEADIYYASFSLTDANIAAEGDIIVQITEVNSAKKGLKDEVEDLQESTEDLQEQINSIDSGNVDKGSTLSKNIIKLNRGYYFSEGWGASDNKGYLDDIINNLPQGKHFLIYTDIHLDYDSTFGLAQNQPLIMKYVHDRLSGCKVIFGGDIIGTLPDEESAKKEILYFIDDNYTLFGSEFIPVLGDHDTDKVSGGLPQGSQLSEQFLYDSVFKWSHLYGATQDSIGINAIDTISSFSDDKKEAWKNYMKMHYYIDDKRQKIRFIVVQQGAQFRTITNNFNTPSVQLPFIAKSILDAPDDYDIVVVSHEFQIYEYGTSVDSIWDRKLGRILSSVKNHSSYTLSRPYMSDDDEIAVYEAVANLYPNSFDFTTKTGNVVMLQGDEHYDSASYYNYYTNYSTIASDDYTLEQNDVLLVIFDRACLVQNPGFPTSQFTNINFVLKLRRAPAQWGGNVLLGTTSEVLFDIVTITNDNKIVLTRVGDKPTAGRFGAYPIFTEEDSYNVGDIVIWYEEKLIDNIQYYVVNAYQFNTSHAAGAWNISEVDEYVVTEPYVRTFDLR